MCLGSRAGAKNFSARSMRREISMDDEMPRAALAASSGFGDDGSSSFRAAYFTGARRASFDFTPTKGIPASADGYFFSRADEHLCWRST